MVQGNGIVELHDSNQKELGFFCMKLVEFIGMEAEFGTEQYAKVWQERFNAVKRGSCKYSDRCPIHSRTIEKMKQNPQKRAIQYTLNFDF